MLSSVRVSLSSLVVRAHPTIAETPFLRGMENIADIVFRSSMSHYLHIRTIAELVGNIKAARRKKEENQ
jgi:hypothetical protein